MTYNFILGASDPEMARIEEILKTNGKPFSYATIDGKLIRLRLSQLNALLRVSTVKKQDLSGVNPMPSEFLWRQSRSFLTLSFYGGSQEAS